MRAVLLAMATVTTRAGLRSIKDRTQAPVAEVLLAARRMTDVAPWCRLTGGKHGALFGPENRNLHVS